MDGIAMTPEIQKLTEQLCKCLDALPLDEKVEALNQVRLQIHQVSPFQEPVDCVLWVKEEKVVANDYNPNRVATPEMKLLETSITNNGFTFPIATAAFADTDTPTGISETPNLIADGFHRSSIGRTGKIAKRMYGYLPVAHIRSDRLIEATIEFNRARGKHQVELMAEIVRKLVVMGRTDADIAKHLGMEAEEVLRLKQMSGPAGLFKDQPYSKAWISYKDEVDLERQLEMNQDLSG
jgi:ParB-like chromosome segregation protein Spo0J